jgi:hypothetical protein
MQSPASVYRKWWLCLTSVLLISIEANALVGVYDSTKIAAARSDNEPAHANEHRTG